MTKQQKTPQKGNPSPPVRKSGVGLKSILKSNETVRPNSEFLEWLRKHLPHFFDKTGDFETDKFRAALAENNIAKSRDGYKLGFVGKDYARLQTGRMSETMIVPSEQWTVNSEKCTVDSGQEIPDKE